MAYQVFLNDGINTVELDTEDLDQKSIIALSDITDISAKKTSLNSIQFKSTKNNDAVLGSFFDFGRSSNFNDANSLSYNYNPLRPVTCLIYEDSNLIFKGSFRLNQMKPDMTGQIVYDAILTSAFLDVKTAIQDKTLSDLDMSDMQHHYSNPTIVSSWDYSTEIYNTSTSAYTTTPFQYGKNYVYPMIDYGFYYSGATGSTGQLDVNQWNARNFKAAVYVREYFNRIFSESNGLTGYTYEIKASPEFNTLFDHLIIPDSAEKYRHNHSGFITKYSKALVQTFVFYMANDGGPTNLASRLVPIQNITYPPPDILPSKFLDMYNASVYDDLLSVRRGFNSASRVKMFISSQNIPANGSGVITYFIEIVKRPAEDNNLGDSGWNVLGSKSVTLTLGQSYNGVIQVDAAPTEFVEGEQVAVRIRATFSNPPSISVNFLLVDISACDLIVPPTVDDVIQIDSQPSLINADIVTPNPPASIKQLDFIKSIMAQFNFFVYSNNDNHKHIIFEKYDDYYVYALPQYLKTTALDWSNKINVKNGFLMKTNIDLPKSYLFIYKSDTDILNKNYSDTFTEIYGQFGFADQYGLQDQKKVELIFSPTIITTENGTDRKYPILYTIDSNTRKQMKTNIRLLYFNGIQVCEPYTVNNLEVDGITSNYVQYYSGSVYPEVSNYYKRFDWTQGWVIDNDLYFNRPRQLYFPASDEYLDAPNSYQNYYINQVTDLTNQDVMYCEFDIWLNEVDMANLDLHIPIYINNGLFNSSYWKLIKVEYNGIDSVSKVSLQKIGF